MVAAKRWRYILNAIEHLPSNSNYVAALADDDEIAEQQDGEGKPQPPRLTEFSPDVRALAVVVDRLGDAVRALIALGGKKPPKIRPYPRPVTAAQRVAQRRKLAAHRALVARVLPHKQETDR